MTERNNLKNQAPEGLPCGMFIYRVEGDQNILFADNNVVHLYGCESFEEFIDYIGNSFHNMVHPDDLKNSINMINTQTIDSGHRHDYLRYRIITKQGEIRFIEDFGHIVYDNSGKGYYFVFIVDIGEEEYYNEYFNSFAEGQIEAMNWKVDHLTGLKNFVAFREDLDNNLLCSDTSVCTVAIFDIISLKKINQSAGRREGDKLIRALVQSIYEHMPAGSKVYRGYDAEIIVVCRDISEKKVLDRIRETAASCKSQVFYGVSSTDNAPISGDIIKKNESLLQALHEAQYDLLIKKMLYGKSVKSQSIGSLVRALEEVDQDTEEHVKRTRNMGVALGRRLGLPDAQLTILELMCLLHDIGKIAIPLEILNKPGKLTNAEWAALRSHADKGYQIAIASKELKPIADYIRYHHERWDGKGYPTGLAGEKIPVISRIISIVDAYDAMVNDRCYRKALSTEHAMKEIRDNAGTQFDPHMAEVFLELLSETPELATGKKTSAAEVRVFKKVAEQTVKSDNVRPVNYCEYKLDIDNRIIEADSSFLSMTGYAPEDVKGKMSRFDLIPPEDLDEYKIHLENQFSRSNTAYLYNRIKRKDGKIVPVVCHEVRQFESATRSFVSTIHMSGAIF